MYTYFYFPAIATCICPLNMLTVFVFILHSISNSFHFITLTLSVVKLEYIRQCLYLKMWEYKVTVITVHTIRVDTYMCIACPFIVVMPWKRWTVQKFLVGCMEIIVDIAVPVVCPGIQNIDCSKFILSVIWKTTQGFHFMLSLMITLLSDCSRLVSYIIRDHALWKVIAYGERKRVCSHDRISMQNWTRFPQ